MNQISIKDFIQNTKNTPSLIMDVRTPDEYSRQNIPQSLNIPLDQIEKGQIDNLPKDKPLYILCQSGNRSQMACKILNKKGYNNAVSIQGGINACKKEPGLVFIQSKTLPLMRQVQIAAGSLVILGIALAEWIHPSWIILSAFVGAGLTFAGFTGFCGMAKLLARMPWNKHLQE